MLLSKIINYIVISLYTVALLHVFLYSLAQLQLLISFLRHKHKQPKKVEYQEWPNVTIQLPLYNEAYVVKRLIDNIVTIDYPQDRLEIQVLDDSTDTSKEISQELVTKYQNLGINIKHITRLNRDGFKAGALKEGLKQASGEFIAVFDADFLPKPNWLKNTLPYFSSPDIGVVQTRWGHLNRNQNLLTKIQAFALDFHFTVEQVGRNLQHHFINFNGTAGIWRKECIYNAGNWHGDTLTEDLDLSYRAQLKGWKFVYLKDVVTPAELPLFISAARSQQFRWNKGAAENFRKNYARVLQSSDLKISSKFHSFFHLLNSSMFFMILMLALLSIPLLFIKHHNPNLIHLFYVLSGLGSSTLFFLLAYWYSYIEINGKSLRGFFKFLGLFIVFFSVAMGLSLHNSVAVLEGHFNKKSGFIRTPKFNTRITENKYVSKHLSWVNFLEVMLLLYFAYGVYAAFVIQDFGLISFHLMLCFGFGFVTYTSIYSKA